MDREVVHLSLGPRANALNAAFYNAQTEYFVYKPADLERSFVSPRVHFELAAAPAPRAAFWDFWNGFGRAIRLPGASDAVADAAHNAGVQRIGTGAALPSWTDSLRVRVDPRRMHRLPTWELADAGLDGRLRGTGAAGGGALPGLAQLDLAADGPALPAREFVLDSDGREALRAAARAVDSPLDEYAESAVRPLLERCDAPQGFNLVADVDAWGGAAAELGTQLADEYPRLAVFAWLTAREFAAARRTDVRESRLHNLVALCETSSLVFPVADAPVATHMRYFETTCLLSALRSQYAPTSMAELAARLTSAGGNIVDAGNPMSYLQGAPLQTLQAVDIRRQARKPESGLWVPQLYHGDPLDIHLEINSNPANLRKLVGRNHELREAIYALTDVYAVSSDSDYE